MKFHHNHLDFHVNLYKFLKNQKDLNYEIYNYLGIERTKFQELYNNALLAFAEQYRDAVLVCNKKNGIFAVKIR